MPTWSQVSAVQPADPYYEWATETNFADLFAGRGNLDPKDRWFPVIIELAKGRSMRDFVRRSWHHPLESSDAIVIPGIYSNLREWAQRTRYCTAMVRKAFLDEYHSDKSLHQVISRLEIGLPLKSAHVTTQWAEAKPAKGADGTVVTGIIDDGIAFANELFRAKAAQTRVEYFWNQDGLPTNPPAGFFEGWELRRDTVGAVTGIDDYLKACTHANTVDEDELYASTRHLDFTRSIHKPVARRGAHGTHVMDLAAGYAPKSAPDNRPIVAVQLPVATTADTSGATLAKYALDAMHYILARADSLAPSPLPVVINLSYGMIAGPHNGTSILEAAIDELIELRASNPKASLSVVLPAGNSRLARCHAKFDLSGPGKERTLDWRILPDDPTPSFMEIWLPAPGTNPPLCEVEVTTPTGDTTPQPIQPGEEWVWKDGTDILCKVLYLTTAAPGRTRDMIFVIVAPTSTLDPVRKVAPFGSWKIKVRKKNQGSATIDAWIQRDDTPYGYPRRGRQSRFEDDEKNYCYRDDVGREGEEDTAASYIKRDGAINAIATGGKTIVVGGFRRKEWTLAKYSAGGPVIPPRRGAPRDDGPDLVAVSDDSATHLGVLASGTRSGSKVLMNGTSVAAPQITRWAATQIAAPAWGNRNAADKFARLGMPASPWAGTRTEANPPPGAPALGSTPLLRPERTGSGRVEFPVGVFPEIGDRKIERG